MRDGPLKSAWSRAVGVLTFDMVLADEHDRLHADHVRARISECSLAFTPEQVLDVRGVAHALHAAARHEPTPASSDSRTPLAGVACYVLGTGADADTALGAALAEHRRAHAATGGDAYDGRAAVADRTLAVALADRLNALLERDLTAEACFRSFVEAGCIDAVGDEPEPSREVASRLLLEAAFSTELVKARDLRLGLLFDAVRRRDTAALCLSGGGLRSATFALGVLNGLARHRLLGKFDYLSTVSGGGYVGGWLSAWMHRDGAAAVEEQLGRPGGARLRPEPSPLRHLRAYSRFLTPRAGLLSADTWTLIATMWRNLLLNWLVLLPLIAAAILVPRFLVAVLRIDYSELGWMSATSKDVLLSGLLLLGVALAMAAVSFVHEHRTGTPRRSNEAHRGTSDSSQATFLARCLVPLGGAAIVLSTVWYLWWNWNAAAPGEARILGIGMAATPPDPIRSNTGLSAAIETARQHSRASLAFLALGLVVHVGGWLVARRPASQRVRELVPIAGSGLIAGAIMLLAAVWFVALPDDIDRATLYATFATPTFIAVILVGSQLFTGWTSRSTDEPEREWSARFNAWLLIMIVGWIASATIVLYGQRMVHAGYVMLTMWGMATVSAVATIVLSGRPARTAGTGGAPARGVASAVKQAALALVVPACTVAIVIALATMDERLIGVGCDVPRLRQLLDCRQVAGTDSTQVATSTPMRLVSAGVTHRVDSLVQYFGPTGADEALYRYLGTIARDASRPTEADVDTTQRLVAAALAADSTLVAHSAELTGAVVSADSVAALQPPGDSVLHTHFSERLGAEVRLRSVLVRRFTNRDTLIARDDLLIDGLAPSARRTAIRASSARRVASAARTQSIIDTDAATRASSRQRLHAHFDTEPPAQPFDPAVPITVALIVAGLCGFGWLMGRLIDTNTFSLHGMYRTRLVRAYLGASRPACDRRPDRFTGFDPGDDIPMSRLWPAEADELTRVPPLHIVNTTLNLVAEHRLAWQQRQAESMTISSLHAGCAFLGYRRTSQSDTAAARPGGRRVYGGPRGITLGTAITISGAAASPNAGYHSSPLVTWLMTLFNARLGAWLGNPGPAGASTFNLAAPRQTIRPILSEMFGLTSDRNPYVYLSDGGHFENLGLYEMVLRRCRFIVVSDAGCDPDCTFEDLGNAVRKIRIDLGVPIEFPSGVDIRSREATGNPDGTYWATARIRYSVIDMKDREGSVDDYDGVLVYLKPAVYGREPRDVYQYAQSSPAFPHESTADQFFTESQFESYRALGEFIVDQWIANPSTPGVRVVSHYPGSLLDVVPRSGEPPAFPGGAAPAYETTTRGVRV